MRRRRNAAPAAPSQAQPPAPPARATVLVVNEALGHASRYGFPSLTQATEYAITQAARSQPFVVFKVLHGAPEDHGPPVEGFEYRGSPRGRDEAEHDAGAHVARLLRVAGARALVDLIAQRHGAAVAFGSYEMPVEGGDGATTMVHWAALDRRPNRWRATHDTWRLACADEATREEALAALAADLYTGNPASPCGACGRQCGAFVTTAPRAFDTRTEQTGRVAGPGVVLCAVCLNGSLAVEDMER